MSRHGEFHTTIEHKGWPIDVIVDYYFQEGTDQMTDPRDVELLVVTDGTGHNILGKLDEQIQCHLKDIAYEKEL